MVTMRAGKMSPSCPLGVSPAIIETLRSNEPYGNENVKKTVGFMSKTTTFHMHHAFCIFLCPFMHDYDVKIPNVTFYGVRKQATTKFYFPF